MRILHRALYAVLTLCVTTTMLRATPTWQQHVSYHISVTLIDSSHTLVGTSSVNYTNNSPDTLHSIFFHLYYNAFQPGSMMDIRSRAIESRPVVDRIAKLPPSEWGKYDIGQVLSQGEQLHAYVTGTIMRVDLTHPLPPGGSVAISVPFKEQIPRVIRRGGWMSNEGVQYSMSQWYPKVAEYDEDGWQIQEYIAREFYGVWGEFQVAITLPSRYVVGATGECTNPKEVGHGYDRIHDGVKEGLVAPDPSQGGITTWQFHANPVHDFAWVADDDYVHEWRTWQDTITIHSFYKEPYARLWEKSLDYTEFALKTYSQLVGPYVYRDFSTTMAGDGGMEYPQLIMITGYRPGLSLPGVIAHEVGHQWFYGMLGSNESRQAFMDEGFTNFMTSVEMGKQFGPDQLMPGQQRSWLDGFLPHFNNNTDNYRGYQSLAAAGYEEPLDIPHDWFREDVNAGQVYGKTQSVLSMLEYTLGDSVFWYGMRTYYQKWRLRHPHLIDFQNVMESVSGDDLDWFFDEWFRTTRTLDYAAGGVSSEQEGDHYRTTVRLKNRDLAVMPIDLTLHYDDGSTAQATIPLATNQGGGYKKPGDARMFLPEWPWVARSYTGSITTPRPVSWFEIDTSMRLQDLNRANNFSGQWPVRHSPRGYWALWKQWFVEPPMDGYYAVVRPIIAYDALGGMNLGFGIDHGFNLLGSGDFKLIGKLNPTRAAADGSRLAPLWYDYLDGEATGTMNLRMIDRLMKGEYLFSKMDGISTIQVGASRVIRPTYLTLGPEITVSGYLQLQDRVNYAYPYYHNTWSDMRERVLAGTYSYRSEDGSTKFDAFIENSIWNSDNNFGRLRFRVRHDLDLGSRFGLALKFVAGTSNGNLPVERVYNLGMANAAEEQADAFWRATTGVDSSFDRKIGAFVQGGAGVRGYAMTNVDASNAAQYNETIGRHMLGFSADLAIPNPITNAGSVVSSFSFGAFVDAGWVNNGSPQFVNDLEKRIMTDAGVVVHVAWLNWLPYQLRGVAEEYAKVPVLDLTFPLYLNHPLDGTNPVHFRWKLGLGTTF